MLKRICHWVVVLAHDCTNTEIPKHLTKHRFFWIKPVAHLTNKVQQKSIFSISSQMESSWWRWHLPYREASICSASRSYPSLLSHISGMKTGFGGNNDVWGIPPLSPILQAASGNFSAFLFHPSECCFCPWTRRASILHGVFPTPSSIQHFILIFQGTFQALFVTHTFFQNLCKCFLTVAHFSHSDLKIFLLGQIN